MSDMRRMELAHLGPGDLIEYALVLERQLRDHIGVEDELKQKLIQQSEVCTWTIDSDEVSTCPNCDLKLVWGEYGGPEENEYKFCPGCGAKIEKFVVEKPEWEEEDERD